MRCFRGCLMAGLLCAAPAHGQSLHVAPSETDRKTPGTFSLALDAPPGKAPVALQWELSVPPAIEIKLEGMKAGKAAESAHKTLTCAASAKKSSVPGGMRFACILAGGQAPLGNGAIAVVEYRAHADVEGAPIRVAVENIIGASADLKRIAMANVDGIIAIR